jgi:hypothetical protein
MFKKKSFWIALLVILTIPAFFKLIRPGFFPMQDIMQVFRSFELDKCIADLQIPCRWIPDAGYGYGYPQFNFYAPAVYYFGEIFHLAGFQFIDSIKIVIGLGFILGTVGMFLLVNEFFGEWAAVTASLLYTYAPFKAQEIYVRGDISEFWATVFFPIIFWATYKLIKNGGNKYLFWTVVSIAGLFFTHVLFSILFIPLIIFWAVYWLIEEKKTKSLPKVFLIIILGFIVSASFTLPMLFEKGFVHIETLLGGFFDYRQHFVTLKELFLSNHWGYGSSVLGPNDDLSLSTGIVQWIMGLVAVIFALFKFKKDKKISFLILCFGAIDLFVLFLTHEKSSFIWSFIKPLAYLQFPWRFLSLSVFILSFLSGYVIYCFGKLKYPAGLLVLILVLALNASFFTPKTWLNVSDKDFLTGAAWQNELTASIFDYLPIYAKLPPLSIAPEVPEILSGNAEFKSYIKGSNYQTGDLSVKEEARIRLPLFDFPGMTVFLNNRIVGHVNDVCSGEPFCMGLITFNAPVGDFTFKVKLENTPVRTIGNIISLIAFIGVCFVFIKKDAKVLKK